MTKLHRDIAVRLLQCVEDEEFTNQATVKVEYYVYPPLLRPFFGVCVTFHCSTNGLH